MLTSMPVFIFRSRVGHFVFWYFFYFFWSLSVSRELCMHCMLLGVCGGICFTHTM